MLQIIVQTLKVVTISAMAILVAAGSIRVFNLAVDEARPDDAGQRVRITVGADDTEDAVADRLAEAGLIRSKLLFQGQLRITGAPLAPGQYTLRKGMTVQQIIDRITGVEVASVDESEEDEAVAGDGDAPETFDITIPEGWRITQIAEEYENQGGAGGYDAFIAALDQIDRSRYDFLSDLPPDASLEGFLFPDTYTFDGDEPAYNIQLMLDNFGARYTPDMRERTREMQLSIQEVLTVAALVEREAQVLEERPIIADVYLSRWEQGWRLDADPTVQYALGRRGEWWPDLSGDDLFADSPYNTYQIEGPPPGPICNPGLASIQAVLFPEDTEFMYFVAKGDGSGEHAFAVTKEEQDANVALYHGEAGG